MRRRREYSRRYWRQYPATAWIVVEIVHEPNVAVSPDADVPCVRATLGEDTTLVAVYEALPVDHPRRAVRSHGDADTTDLIGDNVPVVAASILANVTTAGIEVKVVHKPDVAVSPDADVPCVRATIR